MVNLNEVVDLLGSEENHQVKSESLIDKYKIPVQHFEYSYIETCRDSRELEKIIQVLRSGQEGHFPDLTRFAESRLAIIKPKSKLLRTAVPVLSKENLAKDEVNEISNDLNSWLSTVKKEDDELSFFKNRKLSGLIPKVREPREALVENAAKPSKRITSTDYTTWDKYDPDTEILKMELQEVNFKKITQEPRKTKKVQFREFSTDVEALHEANYERNKGNEFFKVGDYEEAHMHYTESINCRPTAPAFTNRALTNLKLKNYKNTIDDCCSALAIEPYNYKALVRKGQALDALGRYGEALQAVEEAIEINPNDGWVQEFAERLHELYGKYGQSRRLVIEEVGEDEVIIPIPGPSNMSPPHYVTCRDENTELVKEEIGRATKIVHLVSIDTDFDDDDGCTVNHLKKLCSKENLRSDSDFNGNKMEENFDNSNDQLKNYEEKQFREDLNKKRRPQVVEDVKCAGGEPYIVENEGIEMPEDINSPYSFLKTWNSANDDPTLEHHAAILRSVDINRIVNVIGCKLDNAMFSKILKCLCSHFAVPSEVDRLYSILENLINLPRFDIIAMLMSPDDQNCVNILINFLKQHGKSVSSDIINKFFNS